MIPEKDFEGQILLMKRKQKIKEENSKSVLLACYPSYHDEVKPLLRFYQAEDLPELIREMEAHIVRLQDRINDLVNPDIMPRNYREG